MKLTFLPKAARIISFMTALSVIVGPSVATSVQAQTQPLVNPQSESGETNASLTMTAILAQSGGQ